MRTVLVRRAKRERPRVLAAAGKTFYALSIRALLFGLFLSLRLGIAWPFQEEHLSFCGQTFDDDDSGGFGGEDLVPLSEGVVGGHDCAKPTVMPFGDDLEEEIARFDVHGDVAEFINDE